MKRISLLLFMLPALAGMAQEGAHFGLDGYLNMTYIINQNNYGRAELQYSPTYHTAYGMALGYNFDRHFGLQAELISSTQGQKYEEESISPNKTRRDLELVYTHFPIMVKYSGGGDLPIRFYMLLGTQFSFLRSATETYTVPDSGSYSNRDITDRFEHTDLELVFDLGSDFVLYKNFYMSTGLRFNYGLWDINSVYWHTPNRSNIYKGSQNALGGIHVGVHYMFGPPVTVKK